MRKALAVSFLVLVLGVTLAPALHAQGCAMCYTTAAGQDPAAARKLDIAILALLVPVLVLFTGVLGLAIHRRDAEAEDRGILPAELPLSRTRTAVRFHLEIPPSSAD